ncbi:hypothetical protein T492DRAFT_1052434, partial [Pavlovales sp. CCMP2436]
KSARAINFSVSARNSYVPEMPSAPLNLLAAPRCRSVSIVSRGECTILISLTTLDSCDLVHADDMKWFARCSCASRSVVILPDSVRALPLVMALSTQRLSTEPSPTIRSHSKMLRVCDHQNNMRVDLKCVALSECTPIVWKCSVLSYAACTSTITLLMKCCEAAPSWCLSLYAERGVVLAALRLHLVLLELGEGLARPRHNVERSLRRVVPTSRALGHERLEPPEDSLADAERRHSTDNDIGNAHSRAGGVVTQRCEHTRARVVKPNSALPRVALDANVACIDRHICARAPRLFLPTEIAHIPRLPDVACVILDARPRQRRRPDRLRARARQARQQLERHRLGRRRLGL